MTDKEFMNLQREDTIELHDGRTVTLMFGPYQVKGKTPTARAFPCVPPFGSFIISPMAVLARLEFKNGEWKHVPTT